MVSMFRKIYEYMLAGSTAYARWDYNVSMNIISDKRRLLAVLLLTVLPIAFLTAEASELPKVLGGKEAYAPAHSTYEMLFMSIFIGFVAGLITGCIGVGGGFIITPALMSAGVKGILAVGTDQFHIFAKAIMGAAVHKKLGNVSVALAIFFCVGSVAGATIGGTINRAIYYANPVLSDLFINIVYVLMLGFLGAIALSDYLRLRRRIATFDGGQQVAMTRLAMKVQSVNLPPMVKFDHDLGGRQVSAWFVILCGFIVGLVASIMGVGGGFLTFPMYVYFLGVSSFTTVGTDVFQIIITTGYSSILQYAIYGFVFYTLAMGLLLGSLIGIQIGALTTKVVRGVQIRAFYALTILAGFVNRVFAVPGKMASAGWISLDAATRSLLDMIGLVIFFAVILVFAGWVLMSFARNIEALRR